MSLPALTAETFDQIVHELVETVGVRRAYKLRGICRTFSTSITYEIFAKQPIDCLKDHNGDAGHILQRHAGIYLYFRCKTRLGVRSDFPRMIDDMVAYLCRELGFTRVVDKEKVHRRLCDSLGEINHSLWPDIFDALWEGKESLMMKRIGQALTVQNRFAIAVLYGSARLVGKLFLQQPDFQLHEAFKSHLYNAVFLGHEEVVKTILEYFHTHWTDIPNVQAMVGGRENDELSAFKLVAAIKTAIRELRIDLTAYLLEWYTTHLGSLSRLIYTILLDTAILADDIDIVKIILRTPLVGGNQYKNRVAWQHLYTCATRGRVEVLEYFIRHGYIPYYDTRSEKRLLCQVVYWGHLSVLKVLEKAGADLRAPSIMAMATKKEQLEIAQYLWVRGADIPHISTWPHHETIYTFFREMTMWEDGRELPDFKTSLTMTKKELQRL